MINHEITIADIRNEDANIDKRINSKKDEIRNDYIKVVGGPIEEMEV